MHTRPSHRLLSRIGFNLWFRRDVDHIHQCPHCELRYLTRTEMVDHLAEAHPAPEDEDSDDTHDFDI